MVSDDSIKTAWVIYLEGPQHPKEVISLLSARKSSALVKEYLQWLYALLNYSPEVHFAGARYHKPEIPCLAEYDRTNTGVERMEVIRCGYNPYLVGVLAKNVVLVQADSAPTILHWTMPDRLICEANPPRIIEKIAGVRRQAPMSLPFTKI